MLLRALPVLALVAGSARAGDLFVGPTAPFTEIQPAIDAASPGDTVHVAPGEYDVFVLAKPLAVVGAGSALVRVIDPDGTLGIVVRDTPPGSETLVAGITLGEPQPPGGQVEDAPARLGVVGCSGRVTLHDIASDGPVPQSVASRIVSVEACDQVIVSHARLVGSGGSVAGQLPLFAEDSNVWVVGSELRGGAGPDVATLWLYPYGSGVPALRARDSSVHVARSTLVGGRGQLLLLTGTTTCLGLPGGAAIMAHESTCTVAGGPSNVLRGGEPHPSAPPPYHVGGLDAIGGPVVSHGPEAPKGWSGKSTVSLAADVVAEPGLDGNGIPGPLEASLDVDVVIGSTVLPTLHLVDAQPALGATTALDLSGPASSVQFVHVAPSSSDALALPFGDLLIAPFAPHVATSVLDGAGLATLPLAIPTDSAFAGRAVWFQSVSLAGPDVALSTPALLVVAP